jgi:D-alanine transaminase
MDYEQLPAWWNGKRQPLGGISVPVTDRGWLFGDAVYEVIRIYNRRLWLGAEHLLRLRRSLRETGIAYDVDALETAARQLVAESPLADGSLYIQISRGAGVRAHVPKDGLVPNALMFVQPFDEEAWQQKVTHGIKVALLADERWHRCDIKSVNLLGNCMAATAARTQQADEAVLVDDRGLVTEGTHATFMWVQDGKVTATPLSKRILPGITRDKIFSICRATCVPHQEAHLAAADIGSCTEAFLCGTTTEVMPIVAIDGRPVGNGVPGPVARQLQTAYRAAIFEK